jgi:hypothetical protein
MRCKVLAEGVIGGASNLVQAGFQQDLNLASGLGELAQYQRDGMKLKLNKLLIKTKQIENLN